MGKSDVTEKTTARDKPTVKTPTAAGLKGVRLHTVSNGETLSSIALEYYGSTGYIQKIIDANRNLLSNPDRIRVGMRLVIP
jgi:nucleoid-associated protein YgaU